MDQKLHSLQSQLRNIFDRLLGAAYVSRIDTTESGDYKISLFAKKVETKPRKVFRYLRGEQTSWSAAKMAEYTIMNSTLRCHIDGTDPIARAAQASAF